jgi:hypothetical protein
MIFDVGVTERYLTNGRADNWYYRVHDSELSGFILMKQRQGKVVFGVIPLFRSRRKYNINMEALYDRSLYREI